MKQEQNGPQDSGKKPLSAEAIRAIERRGTVWQGPKDIYYDLMNMPVWQLLVLLVGNLAVVNLIFASIYTVMGGLAGLPGHNFGRFANAFFFSTQTFSTTGYGNIYPASLTTNILASIEILLGQLNVAVSTGVLFARLSRPRLRALFCKVAVVRDVNGVQTLSFRVANRRRGDVSEARMSVVMLTLDEDPEVGAIRRMLPLNLEQDATPIFALSWMVSHKITPDSPLWGKDSESLRAAGDVFICLLTGTDEALNATASERCVYRAEDVLFNRRFVDVVIHSPQGDVSIDYDRFHDTEPSLHPLAHSSDIW